MIVKGTSESLHTAPHMLIAFLCLNALQKIYELSKHFFAEENSFPLIVVPKEPSSIADIPQKISITQLPGQAPQSNFQQAQAQEPEPFVEDTNTFFTAAEEPKNVTPNVCVDFSLNLGLLAFAVGVIVGVGAVIAYQKRHDIKNAVLAMNNPLTSVSNWWHTKKV